MRGHRRSARVSGDAVVELTGAGTTRLIAAVRDAFPGTGDHRRVLIGGLAVLRRCPRASRATEDVDTVTGPDGKVTLLAELGAQDLAADLVHKGAGGDTVQVRGRRVEVKVEDDHLILDGVRLDVIETESLSDDDDLVGLPAKEHLFLAAHRWALESATPIRVRVAGPGARGQRRGCRRGHHRRRHTGSARGDEAALDPGSA